MIESNDIVSDLYCGGASIRAISARVCVSYSTVHRALHRAGVQMRPRGGRGGYQRVTVDDAYIADLYRGGASIRAIAGQMYVSYGTVRRSLHRVGVQMRYRGRPSQHSARGPGKPAGHGDCVPQPSGQTRA